MFNIFRKKHHLGITILPIHYGKDTALVTTVYFEYEVDAETFIKNLAWHIEKQGFLTLGNVYESAHIKPPDQLDGKEFEKRLHLDRTNFEVNNLLPRCYSVDLALIEYEEEENE